MKKTNNHLVITILAKKSFQQLKLSILKKKKKTDFGQQCPRSLDFISWVSNGIYGIIGS